MEYQDSLNEFSTKWNTTVQEISTTDWEAIFGESIIKNKRLFLAMEKSCLPNISYYYLQIIKHETILSIIPCFCYNIDILNLITSPTAKYILQAIRKIHPNFFRIKALVTGTYAASCEHFIEYKSDIGTEKKNIVKTIINEQLKNKCKETQCKFILIKDIRGRSIRNIQQLLDKDFHFVSSFPTTAIPILPQQEYPKALKSKYRKRFYDYKKIFEENFTWEIARDYTNYVNQFTVLYNNVLYKAKNKFEFLNVDFFSNINIHFSKDSFLLMAKDKKGETRLMILIFEEKDCLIPLYMGVKYKTDDTRILYIHALGRMVKEAEYRKKKYIDLGQTSYYPKVMSGAFVEDLYYGFWSNRYLWRLLIQNVFPHIFTLQYIPENIYLEKYKTIASKILENKGFKLLNK